MVVGELLAAIGVPVLGGAIDERDGDDGADGRGAGVGGHGADLRRGGDGERALRLQPKKKISLNQLTPGSDYWYA